MTSTASTPPEAKVFAKQLDEMFVPVTLDAQQMISSVHMAQRRRKSLLVAIACSGILAVIGALISGRLADRTSVSPASLSAEEPAPKSSECAGVTGQLDAMASGSADSPLVAGTVHVLNIDPHEADVLDLTFLIRRMSMSKSTVRAYPDASGPIISRHGSIMPISPAARSVKVRIPVGAVAGIDEAILDASFKCPGVSSTMHRTILLGMIGAP